MPPREALRFLLGIDNELYGLEGRWAKEAYDGVHPKRRVTGYHDFFVSRIQQSDRVLDVGCGSGELAGDIASRTGATLTGIDISDKKIALASGSQAGHGATFMVCDAAGDLPEGDYSVVVLSNVLEHLEDRAGVIRKLSSIPSVERVLVRVPAFDRDWRVPVKKELGVEWRLDRTHETEYTDASFRDEMEQAGLEIVHMERCWGEIWAEVRPVARGQQSEASGQNENT